MPTKDRDYHIDRARAEIDHAYRADNFAAASAHFRLASLHMKRVQESAVPGFESSAESLADTLVPRRRRGKWGRFLPSGSAVRESAGAHPRNL